MSHNGKCVKCRRIRSEIRDVAIITSKGCDRVNAATLPVLVALSMLTWQGCTTKTAPPADVAACSKDQLLGYVPTDNEVATHRQFEAPSISYPYGSNREGLWGLELLVRVDATGKAACYHVQDKFFTGTPVLNDERKAMLAGMRQWRYSPFLRAGQPVTALVVERVNEWEKPERHMPMPNGPLDTVHISLSRSGCFGTCPSYAVDIYGSGKAEYRGDGYVDVFGRHVYAVPPESVARLVDSLRNSDIWSLRPVYRAKITDSPTYVLKIGIGGETHTLEDYVGEWAGMRATVSDFEGEVDKVARSSMWTHLSSEALEHLKSEHFEFRSRAGADLLLRAVADEETHDDQALLSLIKLGAPIDSTGRHGPEIYGARGPVIEEALRNERAALIDALIAKGALQTAGRPDQNKIDAAFRAAIAGGNLALVQRIWAVAGDRPHPDLTFESISDDEKPLRKRSPVSLLLTREWGRKTRWDGLPIAKWLQSQGCDLKASDADGTTMLHIAAKAGDVSLVRYLLDHGLGASTPGQYGLPALGGAHDEDVALILLEAGTDFSRMNDAGGEFRKYAEYNHWQSVVAWLTAHGQ